MPSFSSQTITLPNTWCTADTFDDTLAEYAIESQYIKNVTFYFPEKSKLWVGAAGCLLSLANQLTYWGKRIILQFDQENDAHGYLERANFFWPVTSRSYRLART